MNTASIPERMRKLMSPEDRKKLGTPTQDETDSKAIAKSERELQKQIVNYLRLRGIEPIVSRMDRRTSNNVGTPDILFAVRNNKIRREGRVAVWATGEVLPVVPIAWEIKMPGTHLRKEQAEMGSLMMTLPNVWHVKIIRSIEEAKAELEAIGL